MLFSCVHNYVSFGELDRSLQAAILYAGYKIGDSGAATGLLDADGLSRLLADSKT